MRYLYFGNLHPFSKLIFLSFIGLVSFLFFVLLALLIAVPVFGINITEWQTYAAAGNPEHIAFMRFFQAAQSVGMFIAPALIAAYLYSEGEQKIKRYLRTSTPDNQQIIGYTILLIIISLPFVSMLGTFNAGLQLPESMASLEASMRAMEEQAQTLIKSFLITDSVWVLFANIFIVAVIPAVGEELLFRGVIQKILHEWFKNVHIAIITTAALFSFIHFQFYGFLPRFVLGIIFGYLFVWSKNIWYPILAHFINNTLGVIAYFYYSELKNTDFASELDGHNTDLSNGQIIAGLIAGMFIILILISIRNIANKKDPTNAEPLL